MAIGRLYYFTLSILALGFCCSSHYHMWPEKGYLPHKNVGNKHRKDPKQQKKQQRKGRRKRNSDEERRKYDSHRDTRHSHDDGPEWIADFSSKRKGGPKHAESIPMSNPAPAPVPATGNGNGRPRRVSFEDKQPPDLSRQRSGNISNGYVPYDYIYGEGAVKTGTGRATVGVSSPPNAAGSGPHNGSVRSPDASKKPSVASPPSTNNRSKHARTGTSVQGLGLSMGCEPIDTSDKSDHDTTQQSMAPPIKLGNLHKRRAEASPEKFNTGQFEHLQPQALTTTKKVCTEDGTPRAATGADQVPQKTQLTAFLSNFNLTPSTSKIRSGAASGPNVTSTSHDNGISSGAQRLQSSQLTAGLKDFSLATPKAYAIPLSSIAPTPRTAIKKQFNLLNAFCENNELLLLLTSYLNIPSLISLYSISKVYHHQFNCHYTAHILAIMRTWAPHSEHVFPWRNYKRLCTKDPKLRQMSRLEGKEDEVSNEHEDLRDVPTIRWLQMVVYRHGVCTDILIQLATYGHRCPAGTLDSLKRLWFILDLPSNKQRLSVIHSKTYITNANLMFLTHLFIKIDMHFTPPLGRCQPANHPDTHRFPPKFARKGFVGSQMRKTLMAERSFTPLWRVLRGWTWEPSEPAVHMDKMDVMKLWVRHYYHPDEDIDDTAKNLSVMEVMWHELGAAQMERIGQPYKTIDEPTVNEMVALEDDEVWGDILRKAVDPLRIVAPRDRRVARKMLRVDQLVMREGVRREMGLWEHWVRMMVWGWFDPVGRRLPLWTEEQLLRMRKGLPPVPKAPGAGQDSNQLKPDSKDQDGTKKDGDQQKASEGADQGSGAQK